MYQHRKGLRNKYGAMIHKLWLIVMRQFYWRDGNMYIFTVLLEEGRYGHGPRGQFQSVSV